MEKELKTKQDFNEAMQELSKRLGSWPHLKKSFLAIEGKPESELDAKQKKIVKKYHKLKPINLSNLTYSVRPFCRSFKNKPVFYLCLT